MAKQKTHHGLETCEDCQKIFLLILLNHSVRFNALLRECQKNIDLKYSPLRLKTHLRGLQGEFIKRTKRSTQEVSYSCIIPNDIDFELEVQNRLKYDFEFLSKWSLEEVVSAIKMLYFLLALHRAIISVEKLLKKGTPQEHAFRQLIYDSAISQELSKCEKAMVNRSETEYVEILKKLKDERDDMLRELRGEKS